MSSAYTWNIPLETSTSKNEVLNSIERTLRALKFNLAEVNSQKPWGIEFKIQEEQARIFLETFFLGDALPAEVMDKPFGPKILVIESSKRLSWHVHERKDAFLKIIKGTLDVYTSTTDEQTKPVTQSEGSLIHIPELIRHRLGSVEGWAIVAEISRNVFPDNPSNDADERRISDDFGRV